MSDAPTDPLPPSGPDDVLRPPTVSETLNHVVDRYRGDTVTVAELLHALHERGFGLLMAIFVLPNCVPVPIPPGGSTLFSLPLLFICLQMLCGRSTPWMPQWLLKQRINRSVLTTIVSKATPRLRWMERLSAHASLLLRIKPESALLVLSG